MAAKDKTLNFYLKNRQHVIFINDSIVKHDRNVVVLRVAVVALRRKLCGQFIQSCQKIVRLFRRLQATTTK